MASFTYLGPADNLLSADGKRAYHPGDSVPLSQDAKIMLELHGHRFAESDETAIAVAVASQAAVPGETLPRGDRGEVLDIPDARPQDRAAAVTVAPASTGATKSD